MPAAAAPRSERVRPGAPAAADDLEEIWLSIARDNLDAAERVLNELEAACVLLAGRPQAGHIREDLADTSVRFWPVRA